MKVQTRLSLFSSIAFGIIFIVTSALIYGLYYHNTLRSIYQNLRQTSYITAIFFLEEDELNHDDFAKAKQQFNEYVSNSYYQIFNEHDSVSYGSQTFTLSPDKLDIIRRNEKLAFIDHDYICYGIFYEDNQGDFVVITREKKEVLDNQMTILLWILTIAFLIGSITIILLSRWLSHIAYRPFRNVIDQVNNISTHKLDTRIQSPGTKDELEDLINTFNGLLSKISETFIIQKNFVNYVSHEFKTPLTTILGNLEVFSIKDRNPEEYKQLSQTLIQQINLLEEILNTLITISDLRNTSEAVSQLRIDELIWEIITKVRQQYRKSNIAVNINILPEEENFLTITKDRTQLLMALYNLIENAVKYSQGKQVDILLFNHEDRLGLSINDKGIGIPPEQLADISRPFYRADNTNQIQGSGIGLSIALRILEKNHIEYQIQSELNQGTTILLLI